VEWGDVLGVLGVFIVGNLSGGWIFKELVSDQLQGRRARQERQAELQLNLLLSLQNAMEQVNQGRVVWGATKLAAAELMKRWPQ
jgi:hypothetical protein